MYHRDTNTNAPHRAPPNSNNGPLFGVFPSNGRSNILFGANTNANMSTSSRSGSTQSLSRSASVGSHSHQPAAPSYQPSGSFYSPASAPVPQPSTPPLQAGTSYFGHNFSSPFGPAATPNPSNPPLQPRASYFGDSFSSPFGSTVTPNANGGGSIFAGPESSFSRPHESSPLQNRDTLLRSNSFNSPGNPFQRNTSSGSSNTGGLFRDSSSPNSAARPAESNMRPSEVSWRNLCASASLDVGLLTASFNRAYAALDKSKFMHFRQELHRAFVTAGASDLEAMCALEAFCFWAFEQYFLRVENYSYFYKLLAMRFSVAHTPVHALPRLAGRRRFGPQIQSLCIAYEATPITSVHPAPKDLGRFHPSTIDNSN
ncbi:hypothetical protein V8E51_013595 [Hyaloscypha variabilis]